MKLTTRITAIATVLLLATGCYTVKWNQAGNKHMTAPPKQIQAFFEQQELRKLSIDALCPGFDYQFDVGEKDAQYGRQDGELRFASVDISLRDKMPEGMVLVDFVFSDVKGNQVIVEAVDLLRLTPKLDAPESLLYPELVLEEFNRFGLNFRKEFNEFDTKVAQNTSPESRDALDRVYRVNITNNCLEPGKWEFALASEDYSGYKSRRKADNNVNQKRLLSHSWFQLDEDLYFMLLEMKNPGLGLQAGMDWDEVKQKAESTAVDFEQLRLPLRESMNAKLLEVGHQSGRAITPLDIEQHFKAATGLQLSETAGLTYASILENEVVTTRFRDQGFYSDTSLGVFDFGWMKNLDSVVLSVIDVPETDCYVEVTLTGKYSPYNVTIGNVDIALLDEQKLIGMLFGINTYPKSRNYNPRRSTIAYDAARTPEALHPYILLTDKNSGKWVNNQYKGIEKVYVSYDSKEKNILTIYLLSYERITPVWMARLQLSNAAREMVRVRNLLYNY